MLTRIANVLNEQQVQAATARLTAADAPWVDGRVTAGHQGTQVKRNQQISESSSFSRELGDMILASLERNTLFISASLPRRVYPPLFNRYEIGMQFGNHVDGAVRLLPDSGKKIRTDLSATLFLSSPETYDGGELLIEDTYGAHSIKLGAGDMILYPASSLHRVTPVTRGVRLASFFWIESMVRDDGQRTLLFDLDSAIQQLRREHRARLDADARRTDATPESTADHPALVQLTGAYHNLLRTWATA